MKTYRQIRQALTEVGADREEDKNFKLGPEKMSPTPSDEDEYDELDDTEEDEHQVIDAVRPLYVRDKMGQYTTSGTWSSSGTMAQMTQQAATKNLQSEYVPEDGEVLDEMQISALGNVAKTMGQLAAKKKPQAPAKKKAGKKKRGGSGYPDAHYSEYTPDHGESISENAMDTLKKIVARNTAETIRLADGSRMKVDLTTASAILGVHGALNIHNQKKMADVLNSNTAGFAKMSKFAFKQFGSRAGKVGTPNLPIGEDRDAISEVVNQHDINEPGSRANQATKNLELDMKMRQRSPEYRKAQAAATKKRDAERAANQADPGGVKRKTAANAAKMTASLAKIKAARLAARKAGKPVPSPYTAHAGTARVRPAAPRKSRAKLANDYTPDHGEALVDEGEKLRRVVKSLGKAVLLPPVDRSPLRKKTPKKKNDSDYDKGNYPGYWTDKDEEYNKIKAHIKELAGRIKRVDEPIVQEISPGADWADPPKKSKGTTSSVRGHSDPVTHSSSAFGTMHRRPSTLGKPGDPPAKKKKGKK